MAGIAGGAKLWIAGAIKHPGRLKKYAKANNLPIGKAIAKAKKSSNPGLEKAANLAQTLKGFNK